MDFKELKALAKKVGGIVAMNGNTPDLVILSYDNYRKLVNQEDGEKLEENSQEIQEIERLNREILALKEEIRQKEEAELISEAETDNEDNEENGEAPAGLL